MITAVRYLNLSPQLAITASVSRFMGLKSSLRWLAAASSGWPRPVVTGWVSIMKTIVSFCKAWAIVVILLWLDLAYRLNYPVAKHLETIRLLESLAENHGVPHALAAHAGNGIARLHLLPRPDDRTTPERISTLTHAVVQQCHALGGNGVVERALPEHKPGLPVWGLPRADELLMKRIKAQMDPAGLFSPGRFLGGI